MARWSWFLLLAAVCVGLVVVLPSPTRPARPPALRFETSVLDLGACEPGTERIISFPWRRLGCGSLRVVDVRADCSCLLHEGLPAMLRVGSEGALRVRVRIPPRSGPFRASLRVYLDAGPHGKEGAAAEPRATLLRLRVLGYVERPFALVPAALQLGRQSAGRWIECSVEMRGTEAFARRVGPRLRARLMATDDGNQARRVPRGQLRISPPHAARDAVCIVHLRIQVPERPGALRAIVQLYLGTRPLAQVPVELESVAVSGGATQPLLTAPSRPVRRRAHPDRGPPR